MKNSLVLMLSIVIAAMVAFGSVEAEAKKHACKTLKRNPN